MLGNYGVYPDIGVKDLAAAKKFYSDTLGLKMVKEDEWEMYYQTGGVTFNVYKTDYAGTNKATYCTWKVDDVAAEVTNLKGKGVEFEHYDMPGVTLEGDVHVMGEMKAAWFKDPDGNILCIASGTGV